MLRPTKTLLSIAVLATAFSGLRDITAQNPALHEQGSAPAKSAVTPATTDPRLQRIAVMGASLSAGMGLSSELEADADFALVLDALIQTPAEVRCFGDSLVFMKPTADTMEQVEELREFNPTLIIGADLLFWFAYGSRPESERREHFELGLSLLSKIEAPLLLGDIPDMRFSLESQSMFSLRQEYVPTKETLAILNARMREWAAERPNVTIVPLAKHVASLRGAETVTVHGNSWDPKDLPNLLQDDLLHPTVDGSLCTGILMLDALHERAPLAKGVIEWDVKLGRQNLLEMTAAERAETQAKKAKAAERKAKREKRKRERAEKQKN